MSSQQAKDFEGITRQSSRSYLVSSPSKSPFTKPRTFPPEDEIIPDSEEERIKEENRELVTIVISSDSDEDMPSIPNKLLSVDPFTTNNTNSSHRTTHQESPSSKGKGKARAPIPPTNKDDSDVIYISDIDTASPFVSPVKEKIIRRTLTPYAPILDHFDPDPLDSDDSAILTFDPQVGAKPIPRTPSSKSKTLSRSRAPTSTTRSTSNSPRKPKKVSPEQLKLQAYARTLFDELNLAVFDGKLAGTELVWNVRMLTTAGRATRNRDEHNSQKLTIELSTKVVDCEERVRNTLSHEMCHVAVWVLDADLRDTGHGPHFMAWAAHITRARPDIIISKRHSYEIKYKFQWECLQCSKVYGRHSKSINIEHSVCGKNNCGGQLKPLFERPVRRTPKVVGSKLASGYPRESPRPLGRPSKSPIKPKATTDRCIDLMNEEYLDEVVKGLGAISINGG